MRVAFPKLPEVERHLYIASFNSHQAEHFSGGNGEELLGGLAARHSIWSLSSRTVWCSRCIIFRHVVIWLWQAFRQRGFHGF